LDGLEFFDVGVGCCGGPNWGGVVNDGADDGVVGKGDGGLVLTPCPAGKSFKDVQAFFGCVLDVGNMVAEGEMCDKGNAEEFW
jgi:hypothetical protein